MILRKAPNNRIIGTKFFGCLNSYVVLHNARVHSLIERSQKEVREKSEKVGIQSCHTTPYIHNYINKSAYA